VTIRALVVDDEPLARERIRTLLEDEPDIELVGECRDGAEAVRAIDEEGPDLVFLDVQMPEVDGFEVLEVIGPGRAPVVVFVTAYDEYAIRAFDVHALDYLLKPFDGERFRQAIGRARASIRAKADVDREKLAALLGDLRDERRYLERIVVKTAGRVVFLAVDEIDWIGGAGNYVELHAGERKHLVRDTMKAMESKLDPDKFVRVHRSHIVNMDRVKSMEPWFHGEYVLILENGTELQSSRTYSDRLRQMLDNTP